ncbi:hypothetical protein CcCBS67573_g04895 [Chytriomyces confervae]|uniref:Uncharacterized protein n=1 Tax=Chytriomyces confervae TaxID=246404 RepID=A0A507FDL2_9FUNG|nr:hypothetical protein CcCBS67573_g04895 [Chytriomyces confervae]
MEDEQKKSFLDVIRARHAQRQDVWRRMENGEPINANAELADAVEVGNTATTEGSAVAEGWMDQSRYSPSELAYLKGQESVHASKTKRAAGGVSEAESTQLKTTLKNDHSENFVVTGKRPQNYVRDSDPATRFDEYPKLNALFTLKRNLVLQSATPARYAKLDLWKFDLRNLGSQFDVILMDPPLFEYAARSEETFDREFRDAPEGCPPDMKRVWGWDDIASMNVQDIAAPRSFIFIWIGDGDGLERGRDLLAKWGYRRAEDIVWAKTNKAVKGSYQVGPFPVLQRQKEHCLVGIKGTLRRSSDTHFIHCNVDTDIIISDEPANGDTAKPEELYTIIENFCLGKRRLELFGRDHNIRNGWLTVGASISNSNYVRDEYVSWFRNAALVPFNHEIETLRPKSPPPRAKRF